MDAIYALIIKADRNLGEKKTMFLASLIFSFNTVFWIMKPALGLNYYGYVSNLSVLLAALLSMRGAPEAKKPHTPILIALVLVGLCYVVAAVRFGEYNKLYKGLSFALFVPLVMYMLSERQTRTKFIDAFANGSIAGLIFLSAASAITAPVFNVQYSSVTLNPNYLSATVSVMSVCVLYKLFRLGPGGDKKKLIFLSLCMGLALTLIFLSRSRTGYLTVFISLITAFIMTAVDRYGKGQIGNFAKRLFAVIAISVLTIPCFYYAMAFVSSAAITLESRIGGTAYFFTMDSFVATDDIGEKDPSENLVSSLTSALERSGKGLGKNTDDISTGRFGIWKSCIDSLNMTGHADTEQFYAPYRDAYIRNTHNMLLEIGFDSGYPGMLFMLLFLIMCCILYFSLLISSIRRHGVFADTFFFLAVTPVFVIIAMLSNAFFPALTTSAIAFWSVIPFNRES